MNSRDIGPVRSVPKGRAPEFIAHVDVGFGLPDRVTVTVSFTPNQLVHLQKRLNALVVAPASCIANCGFAFPK